MGMGPCRDQARERGSPCHRDRRTAWWRIHACDGAAGLSTGPEAGVDRCAFGFAPRPTGPRGEHGDRPQCCLRRNRIGGFASRPGSRGTDRGVSNGEKPVFGVAANFSRAAPFIRQHDPVVFCFRSLARKSGRKISKTGFPDTGPQIGFPVEESRPAGAPFCGDRENQAFAKKTLIHPLRLGAHAALPWFANTLAVRESASKGEWA